MRAPARRRCFGPMPCHGVACENLVCALKLLANHQAGGESHVDTIFEGLQEQSRLKLTSELGRFSNNAPVKVGGLEKNSVVLTTVKPEFID